MSIWKKILKEIKNPIFAGKPFNLLKYAQPGPGTIIPSEVSDLQTEEPMVEEPQGQVIPPSLKQPKSKVPPVKSVESPENFIKMRYIDEYIKENVRKENSLKNPLPNREIFQELQTTVGANHFIQRTIAIANNEGVSLGVTDEDATSYAERFLNVVLDISRKYFESEDFQKTQKQIFEGYKVPDIQKMKHSLDSLYIINVEGIENYSQKVKKNDKSVQALSFALGDPDPDKLTSRVIDQRFNFFLYNSDKMQDLLAESVDMQREIEKFFFDKINYLEKKREISEKEIEEMEEMVDKKDISKREKIINGINKRINEYQAISLQSIESLKEGDIEGLSFVAPTRNQKINLLAKTMGPQLIQRLKELIINKDEKIIEWVERGVRTAYFKEKGVSSLTGEEGENLDTSTEEASRNVQMQDYKPTREEEIMAYENVSTFAKVYLKDIIDEMRALREKTILPLLKETMGQKSYNTMEKLSFYSKMVLDKVNETLDAYEKAKRNIYRELHEKQDEIMFTLKGREKDKSKKWVKGPYEENLTYIGVPKFFTEQLKKYFLSEGKLQRQGKGFLSEEEIREHIDIYKDSIAKGKAQAWSPELSGVIRPIFLSKKYEQIGNLKKRIKQLVEKAPTIRDIDLVNSIRNRLSAESTAKLNYNEILNYFSDGDPNRFILATIRQNDNEINYYFKDTHNLKVDIGAYVKNLFGQISEVRDGDIHNPSSKAFSQEAVTSYVEMFGPVKGVRVLPEFKKIIGKKSRDDEQVEKIKRILGGENSKLFQEFTNIYEIFRKERNNIEDALKQIRKKLKHRQDLKNQRLKTYNNIVKKRIEKALKKIRKDREVLEQEPINNKIKNKIDQLNKTEQDIELFRTEIDKDIYYRFDDKEYIRWGFGEKYRAGRQGTEKSKLNVLKDLEKKITRYEEKEAEEKGKLAVKKKELKDFAMKHNIKEIDSILNKVAFNLLYSGWKKTLHKISMLLNMKEKYNNIKFASGVSNVDVMIKHTFNQYKSFFFNITRK